MTSVRRAAMDGAIAGAFATTLMTAFMKLYQATDLYQGDIPPTRVTEKTLQAAAVDDDVGDVAKTALIAGGHWGYGIAGGAFFGALHVAVRMPISSTLRGTLFGLLVWAVSYMGWVPAAHIMPPPWRQRRGQALMPLLAHLVYGGALGAVFERLERR